MEFVLVIITSYGLHVPIKITEIYYPSQEICEAKMAEREEAFKLMDHKFAYTMRCEARARG